MKGTFFISIIVIFSILVIPLSALDKAKDISTPVLNTQNNIIYTNHQQTTIQEKVKVLCENEILECSLKDYLFGVVSAEMPALYEKEALKAQAVAAYTFLYYQKNINQNSQYDISADPEKAQCFITRQTAMERWGEKSQEYSEKIDSCIDEVFGEMLVFNGNAIFAAYHAISSGKTNSCRDVWGKDYPYLQSVDSVGDMLDKSYLSETAFTKEQIAEKLKSFATATDEQQDYFTDITRTDNGYIKKLKYCGKEISGSDIANALDLRSCNFEITYSDNAFTFTTKGYGHGVGMSQTGANYMAKQGSSYKEILLHYYNGATLQKI